MCVEVIVKIYCKFCLSCDINFYIKIFFYFIVMCDCEVFLGIFFYFCFLLYFICVYVLMCNFFFFLCEKDLCFIFFDDLNFLVDFDVIVELELISGC